MKKYRPTGYKLISVVTGVLTLFYTIPSFAKDGATIYKTVCQVCHGTGVAGTPKYGNKTDWENRISKGISTLEKNAIKGERYDASQRRQKFIVG